MNGICIEKIYTPHLKKSADQPCEEPRLDISKCKHSSKHWSYHKIAFNSQKAKIWTKVKSFDQFHEN